MDTTNKTATQMRHVKVAAEEIVTATDHFLTSDGRVMKDLACSDIATAIQIMVAQFAEVLERCDWA